MEVRVCVTIWGKVRADIFGVTGKLSHDAGPTHVSGAVAGRRSSSQTSAHQISLSGRALNLLMWLFITLFPILLQFSRPPIRPLKCVIQTTYICNVISVASDDKDLGLTSIVNTDHSI